MTRPSPWLRLAVAVLMVAPAVVAIVVIVGRPWHPVDETWYVTEQGSTIPALLAQPGARLLAATSPLTRSEDLELARLQAQLRQQLVAIGQTRSVAILDQPWLAKLLRNVTGIDHGVAERISALDAKISRHNDCQCAIVVVPGPAVSRN